MVVDNQKHNHHHLKGESSITASSDNKWTATTNSNDNKWRRINHIEQQHHQQQPQQQNDTLIGDSTTNSKERLQRLGYTTGYGSGGINGYGTGTGLSSYSPIKLDIGGVVIGTLVGIGAILIIPKLLSVFHNGYFGGQYARSDINNDNEIGSFTYLLDRFDTILGQNNIDSTSCMQRAVCNYVRSTESNIINGKADQIDNIIHKLSDDNSLVDYMLDGTAIKEAVEHGKKINDNKEDCDKLYNSCPLDMTTAATILAKILSQGNQQ